jgi:uncharacterized GH25 family protein
MVGLCLATPACSHDFWLQPSRFEVDPTTPDPMTIQVGHAQFRTRWSGQVERVVRFVDIGAKTQRDLRADLKTDYQRDATVTFPTAGTEVLAFESNHAASILPAIRFNDYIKFEGLTPALQLRAKTGKTDAPGREIYSRCAKAIVQVGKPGAKPEAHITAPVGLTLEIVPEKNPYALKLGEPLPVHVLYHGHPLAGATVMLTNLEFDAAPLQTKISDASGHASFSVPHVGTWLVNVLWTKPLQGNPVADFDTTFSSLTFGF